MQFNFISKIRSKIHRLTGNTIIQFGPPRSGTTLVYNIIKDIFPNKNVETRHYYREKDKRFPAIVTYRNPLDSISSSILRYKLKPTDEVINQQIKEFEENGIWTVLEIKDKKNILMLKYEDFVNNYEVIFNKLENFFKINIPKNTRNLITERYNIKAVEKIVSKMKSYKEINKQNLFHGEHININKGQPNFHMKFLKKNQILHLKSVYKNFIDIFDY